MLFQDIKHFFYEKLLFPEILVISNPGIIYNKSVSKFGKEKTRTRVAWFFESIYADLYKDTIKKKKTEELWYKIGKDLTLRYCLFSNQKKLQQVDPEIILEFLFNNYKSSGFSFAEKLLFNEKKLKVTGKNNLLCRKYKNGSLMSGVVSGTISYILGENIEAKALCKNCPKNCHIIASKKIKEKHTPSLKDLAPEEKYFEKNFRKPLEIPTNLPSFTNLLKFKKVTVSKKDHKFYLRKRTILTSEIGLPEIFFENYKNIGEEKLIKDSIIKNSRELFSSISKKEKTEKEKLKLLKNIISGFGWGLPIFQENSKKIYLNLKNPPQTKYGDTHLLLVIHGFLESIFSKKFKMRKKDHNLFIFK
jgi:hypothetical protein